MFLLRKQSISCGNLQRRTPVLSFGRKTLFHAPQGESLMGQAGEKAGLSGGLRSSQEDHLSVLMLFSSLRGAWLTQKQGGEAAVAAPMEDCGSGAVPAPAPSHPFGLDCGFLGNHPDQNKQGAHLTGPIKAFLTSLVQAGSVLHHFRVQARTKPPSRSGDAPVAHRTEVSPGSGRGNPAQHNKAQEGALCHFLVNAHFPRVLLTHFHSNSSGKHCQGLISTECMDSEGHKLIRWSVTISCIPHPSPIYTPPFNPPVAHCCSEVLQKQKFWPRVETPSPTPSVTSGLPHSCQSFAQRRKRLRTFPGKPAGQGQKTHTFTSQIG